jgi:hypothetical protein
MAVKKIKLSPLQQERLRLKKVRAAETLRKNQRKIEAEDRERRKAVRDELFRQGSLDAMCNGKSPIMSAVRKMNQDLIMGLGGHPHFEEDDFCAEPSSIRIEPSKFLWSAGDGRLLHPYQMEERHLRNAISFVSRRMVHEIGTTVWLKNSKIEKWAEALYEFLREARRRELPI